jgi:hypothetical protein
LIFAVVESYLPHYFRSFLGFYFPQHLLKLRFLTVWTRLIAANPSFAGSRLDPLHGLGTQTTTRLSPTRSPTRPKNDNPACIMLTAKSHASTSCALRCLKGLLDRTREGFHERKMPSRTDSVLEIWDLVGQKSVEITQRCEIYDPEKTVHSNISLRQSIS